MYLVINETTHKVSRVESLNFENYDVFIGQDNMMRLFSKLNSDCLLIRKVEMINKR